MRFFAFLSFLGLLALAQGLTFPKSTLYVEGNGKRLSLIHI